MDKVPDNKKSPFQVKGELDLAWKVALGLLFLIGFTFSLMFVFSLIKQSNDSTVTEEDVFEQQRKDADLYLSKIEGADNFTKIALAGKEYLFEDDIKAVYSSQGRLEEYEGNPSDRGAVIDMLINQSIALQEGERKNWLELDETFFNNPVKDNIKRGEMYSIIISKYYDEFQGSISVEGCSVWFYPTKGSPFIDQYGLEAAKQKAREKIDYVYAKIKKGELNMSQAGDILANDPEVQALNPDGYNLVASYKSASYFKQLYDFKSDNSEEDKEAFEDQILTLSTGEVTDIITANAVIIENDVGVSKEAFFIFYRALDSDRDFTSYDEWVESFESNYIVEKY